MRVIQDSVQKITVESHQNIINVINTVITEDTWRIRFRQCFRNYDKFEVIIYTPHINGILLSGSGNIQSDNVLASEVFQILLGGSGSISLIIDSETVITDISGSGNINLSGSTTDQNINISGSGNVTAFELTSSTCDVTIPDAGNCDVTVEDRLDVTLSGTGNVRYKGNPAVNSSITGSGNIVKID